MKYFRINLQAKNAKTGAWLGGAQNRMTVALEADDYQSADAEVSARLFGTTWWRVTELQECTRDQARAVWEKNGTPDKMVAAELKPGDEFRTTPRQRKTHTVGSVIELQADKYRGPAEHLGQLLISCTDCQQILLAKETEIWPPPVKKQDPGRAALGATMEENEHGKPVLTFLVKDKPTQEALKAQPHLLRVDEDAKPLAPRNGKKFTEEELCELLNCRMSESIPIGRTGLYFLIDGEGKLADKPYNHLGTKFWLTIEPQVKGWDYVAGDCIICNRAFI